MIVYNIDIRESPNRSGTQKFDAVCRETCDRVERSSDPERDIARNLTGYGVPDGRMQTWRGETPALLFPSVRRATRYSVGFESEDGWRLRKHKDGETETKKQEAAE